MNLKIGHREDSYYAYSHFSFMRQHRRWMMIAWVMLSDLLGFSVASSAIIILWSQIRDEVVLANYSAIFLPVATCLIVIYAVLGLYPGTGLGPVEELRRLTHGTTLLFLGMIVLSFYMRNTLLWSRAIISLTWFLLVCGMPILRKLTRRIAVYFDLWGEPVIVIGCPECANKITQELRKHPLTGYWPVLSILTDAIEDVFPVNNKPSDSVLQAKALFRNVEIVILAPGMQHFQAAKNVLIDQTHTFKKIIVIFDEERLGSIWFTNLHLQEFFGLEIQHRWGKRGHTLIKRLIDFVLILISAPLMLPLILITSAAIVLDSPGGPFFSQKRLGKNGRPFYIWKFRTMYADADNLLKLYLEDNPALKKEWAENYKLKQDPRVTRVGRLLRLTSLDELPQVWNVLKGEMSMIGPRPIVEDEVSIYGPEYEFLKRVTPGITGLWQISGRNDLPYHERVTLDLYYLQNWSIWLDIHILIHTILAVFLRTGAY